MEERHDGLEYPGKQEHRLTGRLAFNVMQFCRALRAAGLPVGPGKTLAALEAVEAVGLDRREDVYWALHATLVNRQDQRPVFDQAFHMFWRNPDLLKRALTMMLPEVAAPSDDQSGDPLKRRVADAFAPDKRPGSGDAEEPEPEVLIDASLTVSDQEVLQTMDFEQMTAEEIERARRAIARLTLPLREVRTRRYRPDPSSTRIDMRRTLRQSLRQGGGGIDLARKRVKTRPPPLVAICDISGSMGQYSRMLLHFLHGLTSDRDRVHSFVFGTRLTNITRYLRTRDVDDALRIVGQEVNDWSGGTRIGACLHDFNREWARRVLTQGPVVLLITDGLDRGDPDALETEIDRLHRSCRRLMWLNPLLRYDAYAPKSQGAQRLVRHVDDLHTVHNLNGLADLAEALAAAPERARPRMRAWRDAAVA